MTLICTSKKVSYFGEDQIIELLWSSEKNSSNRTCVRYIACADYTMRTQLCAFALQHRRAPCIRRTHARALVRISTTNCSLSETFGSKGSFLWIFSSNCTVNIQTVNKVKKNNQYAEIFTIIKAPEKVGGSAVLLNRSGNRCVFLCSENFPGFLSETI